MFSNGQQRSTIQQLTETNEYKPASDDSNTGQWTSRQVRKRTQVNERCECDTEIMNEEKEKGTQVMRCKVPGCKMGWVHTSIYSCIDCPQAGPATFFRPWTRSSGPGPELARPGLGPVLDLDLGLLQGWSRSGPGHKDLKLPAETFFKKLTEF